MERPSASWVRAFRRHAGRITRQGFEGSCRGQGRPSRLRPVCLRAKMQAAANQRGEVGVLLITCPATGKEFSMGVQVDQVSLRALRDIEAIAYCPHCKADHSWRPRDTRSMRFLLRTEWRTKTECRLRPAPLPDCTGKKFELSLGGGVIGMTGAFCESCDDNNRHLPIPRIRDRPHAPVGKVVCGHLRHASRPTSHVAVYSAYLSIPKGRRRGRGQAEHRPHSVTPVVGSLSREPMD